MKAPEFFDEEIRQSTQESKMGKKEILKKIEKQTAERKQNKIKLITVG